MILIYIKLICLVFLLFGCHANNKNEVELLASSHMLNYSYNREYQNYNLLVNVTDPPPRTQEDFLQIKFKSDNGNSNSSLLLFNLFERDSNCMCLGLNEKAKPNKNCLLAIKYLERALIQEPTNSLALYEYAILHFRGIVFPQDRDKAKKYMDEIFNKGWRDAALVCEYLIHMYTSNEDGKGVYLVEALKYASIGSNLGNKKCHYYYLKT